MVSDKRLYLKLITHVGFLVYTIGCRFSATGNVEVDLMYVSTLIFNTYTDGIYMLQYKTHTYTYTDKYNHYYRYITVVVHYRSSYKFCFFAALYIYHISMYEICKSCNVCLHVKFLQFFCSCYSNIHNKGDLSILLMINMVKFC